MASTASTTHGIEREILLDLYRRMLLVRRCELQFAGALKRASLKLQLAGATVDTQQELVEHVSTSLAVCHPGIDITDTYPSAIWSDVELSIDAVSKWSQR